GACVLSQGGHLGPGQSGRRREGKGQGAREGARARQGLTRGAGVDFPGGGWDRRGEVMETPAGPPPSDREAWDHIATQAVRGPLSWIISHLDAMDSDIASQYSPASKKALGNARAASKRLLDMLESLLAAQRISSGMEPLVPAPVGLNAALEPVVKQLVLRATSEGKTYTFASEALGLAATANEDLLRRAVRLVSNRAMDEAQKGGNVRVTASAMSGGITRIRIQATPPAEDSGAVGLVVPAEIGFARMAVEQMGGK